MEPNDDNETKAVEQFCCENCGHINSKKKFASNVNDCDDDVNKGNVSTERRMDKRKRSMCDVDVDSKPKLLKIMDSLSGETVMKCWMFSSELIYVVLFR